MSASRCLSERYAIAMVMKLLAIPTREEARVWLRKNMGKCESIDEAELEREIAKVIAKAKAKVKVGAGAYEPPVEFKPKSDYSPEF